MKTPRPVRRAWACAFALLALAACSREPEAWFREGAREHGLQWKHVSARTQRYWFPEIMGGGVGLLDYDGDGLLDVFLVQSGDLAEPAAGVVTDPAADDVDRLFRNRGGAHFEDVTARAGAADPGYGMGCTCGDADGDGDTDLYVTNVGPNTLWRNDAGVFRDATAAAGVGDPNWGTSAAFVDYDADGDLDLFVVNYVRWSREHEVRCRSPRGGQDYCSPLNYDAPTRDVLYRNEGGGRFEDVSVAAGLTAAFGNGLGTATADFDQDGRIDLFVANDQMPSQLWMNRGDGSFVDRALYAGCAVNRDGAPEAGMGVVAADIEDDGDLDVLVTHLRDEMNGLYLNQQGIFTDQAGSTGLGVPSLPFTGFGAGMEDFDRDGVLDVFVANGAVTQNPTPFDPTDPYAEPNLVFRGRRTANGVRFDELLPRGGTAEPLLGNGRGAAFGDLDEDGDVDVVVVENGGQVRWLENVAPGGHWISLALLEPGGGAALGAAAALESDGRTRYRWVPSGSSYCSSSDPRILCGLGDSSAPVTVRVRWVDNRQERFGPLAVDQKHTLRRGAGLALPP